MLECKEGRFWVAQWFISIGPLTDFLGALFRDGNGPWLFMYRVAYRSPDGDDDKTVKNWFTVTLSGKTKDQSTSLVEDLVRQSAEAVGVPTDRIIRTDFNSDDQEAVTEKLLSLNHTHVVSVNGVPLGPGGSA
jgi:hypothetical protein